MARHRLGTTLVACISMALPAQEPAPPLQQFRNRIGSFQIDLPIGWRQLAPNEARSISLMPGAPADLGYVEPRLFYAIGPVDEWLHGRFESPWLWVVEQDNEWQIGKDIDQEVAPKLIEMWRTKGEATGVRHEVTAIRSAKVGPHDHTALLARRTSTQKDDGRATESLDMHAPAGGQQFSLSFTCAAVDFARLEPEFRRWLGTLKFARSPRGEQKVSDRLWTPILTGAGVGLVLLLLYKHTRRRPSG